MSYPTLIALREEIRGAKAKSITLSEELYESVFNELIDLLNTKYEENDIRRLPVVNATGNIMLFGCEVVEVSNQDEP